MAPTPAAPPVVAAPSPAPTPQAPVVAQPAPTPAAPTTVRFPSQPPGPVAQKAPSQPVVAVAQRAPSQPVMTVAQRAPSQPVMSVAPKTPSQPPAPASARGSVPPFGSQPPSEGAVRTPSGRYVRGRTSGDELISALFESMHDLHFLRDALDGGQFCLALATEVLPARAALIHFFDIGKREWVIACTRGKDTMRLLTLRTPEADEQLREAARVRRALVVSPSLTSPAQRYQSLGPIKSLIVAPIMQAGRALGALEIINPLDGQPFTADEGNAMTYIAEQYAEYLGSRGIVLDRDRIQRAATPR
jgi:hypothetical protein